MIEANQPLYLDGTRERGLRVTAEGDGVALKVAQPKKSPVFFPLPRLSRVFASQWVSFETPALLACAHWQVPIVMLSQDGKTLLRVMGTGGRNDDLRQRLDALLTRHDGRECFDTWRVSMQRRMGRTVAQRLRYPESFGMRYAGLCQRIDQKAVVWGGVAAAELSNALFYALSVSVMQSLLLQRGLDARSETWQLDDTDIIECLAVLLVFRLQTVRLGWLKSMHLSATQKNKELSKKDVIRVFERHHSRIERFSLTIINALHRWLVRSSR